MTVPVAPIPAAPSAAPAAARRDGGATHGGTARPARPQHRAGPGPRPRTQVDLLGVVRAFAQLYLEVEAGRRERRHLTAVVPPAVAARLLTPPAAAPPGALPLARVHRLFGMRTTATSFDAVVVLRRERRYEALAVRLRRCGSTWNVTEAQRPQDQAGCRVGQPASDR